MGRKRYWEHTYKADITGETVGGSNLVDIFCEVETG